MLIEADSIDFSYDDEVIFDGFSFAIDQGERVVLKGESGGGKSTLMRLLLGFELPDQGELRYKGSSLKGKQLKQFRKECAWLPQDLNIGAGAVRDVILFPFQFKESGNREPGEDAIISILGDLGMEKSDLEKDYADLSTGQRQRVGIALCILLDKPVMLLDEPTSALDETSKEKAFKHLFADEDRTIISTSHDPFWIDKCDRVIDLDSSSQGR